MVDQTLHGTNDSSWSIGPCALGSSVTRKTKPANEHDVHFIKFSCEEQKYSAEVQTIVRCVEIIYDSTILLILPLPV